MNASTTVTPVTPASVPFVIPPRPSSMPGYPIVPGTTVSFPRGIPGFEGVTPYRYRASDLVRPFMFMEAVDSDEINFVCIDPFALRPDFQPRLSVEVVRRLGLTAPDDAVLLAIVTVGEAADKTTANLQCPLVINRHTCIGEQVILDGSGYPMQHALAARPRVTGLAA